MAIENQGIPERPPFRRGDRDSFDFSRQKKWNIPDTVIIKTAVVGRPPDRRGSPSTLDEIITQSMKCVDAGACSLHFHAHGETAADEAREFHRIVDPIREKYGNKVVFDCSLCTRPTFEDELALAKAGIAELVPVNLSLQGQPQPMKLVQAEVQMLQENGIKPEIAIYCDGDIDRAKSWLIDTGICKKPGWWDLLPSYTPGSTPMFDEFGMAESLMYQVRQIRLIDPEAIIMVAGCGRPSSSLIAMSILLGLHVKVGMEDVYFWWANKDDVMDDNVKNVADTVTIASILGRRPATGNECRALAGLQKR
jgi:3-keto-5-aminohexanoate cleavage enzyme